MGPADQVDITGAKGGSSKPKTPVEAPDSLQSTNIGKILIAVGEGEFDGEPTDRDIYLDNTPIMDASGSVNFPGVRWEWRSGSVEQDYIQGIPAIENETTVNVELRSDNPFARALSNIQLSAVRVRMAWPRLAQQDSSGNTNGYRIEYAIDIATDGGAYVEAHLGAVDGKTTNGYQRSVRVNLPKATSGWMLRVRRITPNANSGAVADTMTIAGYTEIIDQKLRYPNTALLYIEFDAQQFQNIPAVTVKCKAKRWPVPTNYDPVARTYTGVWDGTFKQAWTNNPAFVTYGLCVEDRFGLGKRIKSWMVDKWEMYRIAQYCDQQVPNGQGGQEARFLCDMNLQGRAEAWTLLRDLSAIYRGMVYWAHGSLFMQADMPRAQDIDYVFTRANVIDGEFVYGGAERNTHYSRALVSYDNPANNYDTDVIPVTDNALQRRYRDRPVEISAIGCTRASEAQRRGKWALLSNSQDRTVTFKTGMEGRIPLPGYVIPVADELVAGRPNGGRISAAAGRVITLDRDTPIKAGDRLILNLPNGTAQARTVASVRGRAVTVTTAYGLQPEPELQWAIDYDDLAVQLFRVLKTTRTQEGDYEITALEFNPSKFAAIDTGAKLDERPISVIPVTTVQPPASVTLSSAHMIDQGIAVSTMTIAWPAVAGAVAYDVEWRKDNGNWVSVQRTGAASVDVVGIYAGAYLARVRAVSAFDITSMWTSSVLTQLTGKEGLPPSVTFLEAESLLFGIGIKWGFPAGAEDTQRTELWYSEGTDLSLASKLADLAYPQNEYVMQGLRAGQRFYFWARLVDRSGNIGPFYPVEGTYVTGAASADAGPILEQIAGEILESHLGQQLTEKIDLIDGNGPGSVNERVESARSELSEQVAEVNNAVAAVSNSVTAVRDNLQQQVNAVGQEVGAAKADLQQKIDAVSVLAGSLPYNKDKTYTTNQGVLGADGKLYQAVKAVPKSTPPPNATYWTDVGQAIVTAAGTASRVSKVETDVSTLDGKTTAQATQLGGLQTSLTTTNQNVATAQQAADAANTLAGGKGKVIIQAAAPAAADRLAQNLWIDTTGNANTPKRWSGSAWVAVTDKAATDAAAAAASALALAQTKADATVVNSVTLRVSDVEGKLVSEGKRIDGLQTSVDGKASSAALQEVTSRVTATERDIASTSSRTSTLENAVNSTTSGLPSKASTVALNSVSGRVTATEQGLSSQAESVSGLTASVKAANSAGGNIVPNASFDPAYSQMGYGVLATTGADVPAGCPFKYAARLASRDHYPALADVPFVAVKPGDIWRVSALVACVSGAAPFHLYIQIGSDPATIKGTGLGGGRVNTTSVWTRTSWEYTVPAGVFFIRPFLQIEQVANGGTVWLATDWHMEDVSAAKAAQATADATASALSSTQATVTQQGDKLIAEGKRIDGLRVDVDSKASSAIVQSLTQRVTATEGKNGTQDQQISSQSAALLALTDTVAGKANASTVQALSNTVNQQGQDLTAAGAQLTNISASLSDAGSENLIYNPSFEKPGSAAGVADGWGYTAAGGTRNPSQPASTLAPGGVVQRMDLTGLSSSVWFRLRTATDRNVKVASGSTYTLSFYVRATAGLDVKAQINGITSSGAASGTWQTNLSGATGEWRRLSVTFTPADTTVEVYLAVVVYGTASTSAGFIEVDNAQFERGTIPTGWRDNNSVTDAAQSATAAAVDSLTATVSQQAGALSSVSGRTTSLENSLTTTNGNVDKAQQVAQASSDLAGSKGKVLVQAAAPAAADRQAQNLWIDTTGNANTPKRWNGTGWAAVTDKVATDAAAAAQSALAEVAKKADATAVQALASRVTANEQGLTSAAESVTNLGASIKAANSAGGNIIPNATFDPAFTRMGFTVLATTASGVPAGCPFKYAAQLTARDHNPALADVPFAAVKPGDVWRLNALVACAAGAASFNLYIQIGSDPATVSRTGTSGGRVAPTSTWTRTTFDYTVPAGVYFIRPFLQIDQAAGAGTVWYATDWHMEDVSAAKAAQVTADATATALSSTQATVSQQGNKLTAETSRIDGLYTSVGNANTAIQNEATERSDADAALSQQIQTTQSSLGSTNASVQQISTAQTGLNNRVNAQYSIKVAVTQSGVYALGGIGVGIQNQNGVLQSVVAVLADQFAVINAAGNGFVSPFAVQGGQVFINDAFIRDASITNAKIANAAITSAKIGVAEIDTLRIRGNAVTVPVSASSAGVVYGAGEGQWRDLIAIGVQMDEAGYITAQYSCYQGFGGGTRKYQFRMELNGLVIAEGGGDWADGFPNLMGSIGVGPGYFVITVKWWGENSGVSVKNHTLYAMGTKR